MSNLNRRQALRLFTAAGVAGMTAPILSACSTGSDDSTDSTSVPSGPPVKIGMIVPQTGAFKDLGNELDNGFSLYLQAHGNKLGGRQVTLVKVDEGETGDTGKAAAEKLIKEEKVLALTGVVNPQSMLAMKETVEAGQIPLVGSNASPSTLQGAKYIWRTSFVSTEPAQAIGPWVAANGGGAIAVIGQAGPNGDEDDVRMFVETLRGAGGNIAGTARTTPYGSRDFAAILGQVKNSGANALYASYGGATAVEFVKQFRNAKFPSTFKLFAPGSLTEGYLLKQLGDSAKDIYTSLNYSPDLDNASNRRFVAEYQKAFGSIPSTYAMASYDAAAVLDKAITDATKSLDSFSLNAAIGRLGQIDSPRGGWQFSQNRAPLQRWYLRQVRADGAVLSNVLTAELTTLG
ncbi:ABC transporter substrate-binding protein [Dactylosporangium sp. CA-139066]|uniref:ABC transporter substrate-binding protein n=1 Tax=Dactylosporangium sp. CA-139066 TaxID=3239930 RepID=UPI003D8D095E